ncbi:hypothetical protein DVG78_24435 [Runella aurantiaca]|uniref:Uncharacterized protein n=1 Tax=Runella aurantiaca TaxID=2282308 RepID=A0A369I845_9BACT|nr:hypothetical protein DVG78_24435 [Runella aurantiaca]
MQLKKTFHFKPKPRSFWAGFFVAHFSTQKNQKLISVYPSIKDENPVFYKPFLGTVRCLS